MKKNDGNSSSLHIKIGFALMLLVLALSMGIAFVSYYGSAFAEQTSSSQSSASSDGASGGESDYIGETGVTAQDVMDCMETGLASAFKSFTASDWEKLSDEIQSLSKEMSIGSETFRANLKKDENKRERCIISVVLVQAAEDYDLFDSEEAIVASAYKKYELSILQEDEKSQYDDSTYSKTLSVSEKFAALYGNATKAELNQVILYTGSKTRFNFQNPIVNYNGTLIASIDDLYQYIDATCSRTPNSATISISADNRIEMTAGENQAYVNDRSAVMTVPVLYINGLYYISIDFFAKANDIGYAQIKDQSSSNPVMILYGNLNQLENSAVKNTLNTSSLKTSSSSQSSQSSSSSSSSSSSQGSSSR